MDNDMKNTFYYKGFIANFDYDSNTMEYYGIANNIKNNFVHFHANTIDKLIKAFHESVEAHLEMSKKFNKKYKGSINEVKY